MIYIDASAYLALLMEDDPNHQKALAFLENIDLGKMVTSQAVLGEVLTVGSQRFSKQATITFVKKVLSDTTVIFEDEKLVKRAFVYFNQVPSKNVSWVDCYSFAIMKELGTEKFFSFDKDFKKLAKLVFKS